MEGVPEKAIFRSVKVYNKHLSSQCNLPAQIEEVQDKYEYAHIVSIEYSPIQCLPHKYIYHVHTF